MLRHIKVILKKELLDTIRDRKTLFAMIVVPLVLMPLLMMVSPLISQKEEQKVKETVYNISVVGEQNSPSLVSFLQATPNTKVVIENNNLEEKLKKGEVQLIVTIQEGFEQAVQQEKSANLILQFDSTQPLSANARKQFDQLLNAYSKNLVAGRLAQKGLNTELLEPVKLQAQDTASQEKVGGLILAMIMPLILTIWAVSGGMYTAIDVSAGEKERGTLEPLLLTPPRRLAIVTGKFLAILSVAMAAIILALISMVASLRFLVPMIEKGTSQQSISLSVSSFLLTLFVAFLLTAFICALELTICTWARNFKQAQNYITPLYLVIILPAMVIQIMQTFVPPSYLYAIPVLNTMLAMKEIFMGKLDWIHLSTVTFSSLVFIAVAFKFMVNTYNREEVLFRS
jgi:sodium transport system permease protein